MTKLPFLAWTFGWLGIFSALALNISWTDKEPAAIVGAMFGAFVFYVVASAVAAGATLRAMTRGQRDQVMVRGLIFAGIMLFATTRIASFVAFECRSMQVEAKRILPALVGHGEPGAKPKRYLYSVLDDGTARAVGVGELDGDEWVVDAAGKLTNTRDVCAR